MASNCHKEGKTKNRVRDLKPKGKKYAPQTEEKKRGEKE